MRNTLLLSLAASVAILSGCARPPGGISARAPVSYASTAPVRGGSQGDSQGNGRLVVLMITDNTDHQHPNREPGSIGEGVTNNAQSMSRFFNQVRDATGMPVDVHTIAGTNTLDDPFNCDNITRTIKSLPVRRNDAVMVYYAGHGFNIGTSDTRISAGQLNRYAPAQFRDRPLTEFPFLACGTRVENTPNLDMIAAWLSEKKPRLTIVMADACNSFDGGSGPDPSSFYGGNRSLVTNDERLRSLFQDARGTVLMTSSQRGHLSYYDISTYNPGGLFTRQFLSIINAMPASRPTSWEEVGRNFTPMTVRVEDPRTRRRTTDVQTPVIRIGPPFSNAVAMP